MDRDDRPSVRYCADHSLLLSVFWLVAWADGFRDSCTVLAGRLQVMLAVFSMG